MSCLRLVQHVTKLMKKAPRPFAAWHIPNFKIQVNRTYSDHVVEILCDDVDVS